MALHPLVPSFGTGGEEAGFVGLSIDPRLIFAEILNHLRLRPGGGLANATTLDLFDTLFVCHRTRIMSRLIFGFLYFLNALAVVFGLAFASECYAKVTLLAFADKHTRLRHSRRRNAGAVL